MKILITGGAGFIGRNLKGQLNNKYDIFAPTSSEVNLLDDDRVCGYLKQHRFDVVIHTATWNATKTSSKDLTKVLENNLRMFFNIARCSDYYGKMIYFGSGAEYDRGHWIPKMRADYFDTYVPVDQYGFSKYIMRKYAEQVENIYNLCIFGVFGKYEDWQIRFISNACCKAVFELSITIEQNVFFDYMYVDDLVKITEWFIINTPKEKTYNVCTGQTYDLLTLAKKVLKASGKNLDIIIKNEGLGKEYSGDNSRLLRQIGNYMFQNIDICIDELYQWYLVHLDPSDKERLLLSK